MPEYQPFEFSGKNPPQWAEPLPLPNTWRVRRKVIKGYKTIFVAIGVEPSEYGYANKTSALEEFGRRAESVLKLTTERPFDPETDERLYFMLQDLAKNEAHAIERCMFKVRRILKKIGMDTARISIDTRRL